VRCASALCCPSQERVVCALTVDGRCAGGLKHLAAQVGQLVVQPQAAHVCTRNNEPEHCDHCLVRAAEVRVDVEAAAARGGESSARARWQKAQNSCVRLTQLPSMSI